MNAHETLDLFLRRLELATPQAEIFDADELKNWDPQVRDMLLGMRALLPASPAKSVVCDACAEGHIGTVFFVPSEQDGTSQRGYITCDEHGPVLVEPERLLRWRADLAGLAELVSKATGCQTLLRVLVPGRLLDLGVGNVFGDRLRVFLGRGLNWVDGGNVLSEFKKTAGSSRALIVLPAEAAFVENPQMVVLPLIGNVIVAGEDLTLALPNMETESPLIDLMGSSVSVLELVAANPKKHGGRPRLIDDAAARDLYEQGEALRRKHPGITRPQVAANLGLSPSAYKRHVRVFRVSPKPERPTGGP